MTYNPVSGTAPIDLTPSRLPPHLRQLIHEAVGEASVCWRYNENDPTERIFDTEAALECASKLCNHIADELEKRDMVLAPHLGNAAFNLDRIRKGHGDVPDFTTRWITDAINSVNRALEIVKKRERLEIER